MKASYIAVCVCILCSFGTHATHFDHDLHYKNPENGDEVRLKSVGKLTTVIDLDDESVVKRVLCKDGKILIALNDVKEAKKWKTGDILIGSAKLDCKLNSLDFSRSGIYSKIASVTWASQHRVDVTTSSADPLDAFEDANIEMHYTPAEHLSSEHSRKKRHISNVLTNLLGTMDWKATNETTVRFNPSNRPIILYKRPTDTDVQVLTNENDVADFEKTKKESDFYMTCISCTGFSKFSYHLILKINKVNNKPQLVKYLSEVETIEFLHYNMTIQSFSEITLNHQQSIWKTERENWAKIELAGFKKIPPVVLSIDYSSETFLDLTTITKGPAKFHGEFDITGKFVISENNDQGQAPSQQTTPRDWTVTQTGSAFSSNSTLNGTVSIYQTVNFNASIEWTLKDIHLTNGPPLYATVKPTVYLNATADEITHCDNSSVSVTGHFTRPADWVDVNAFGINVWHALMSDGVDVTTPILDEELTTQCRANCFGQAEKNELADMVEVCGAITEKVVRGDNTFMNFDQLWGDFILFQSEESSAEWCGNMFRDCISCINSTVGDTIDEKCADRMMTSEMATQVTKLGRFVRAEWPTRKLIVKESWDEPTSEYPDGSHGDVSLYYEGRAVQAGISTENMGEFSQLDYETDPAILQRLGELAVCSGFGYVRSNNITADIEVCMAPKVESVKRRRRATGNTARDPNEQEERKAFDAILKDIKTPNITRDDLKKTDYKLLPGEFYPKGKKLNDVCGSKYYGVSSETLKKINNIYQFPYDNVNFLSEGGSKASCGSETRACKDSCPYVNSTEPRSWCTSRTMLPALAKRLMNMANWITNNAASTGEIIFLVDVSGSMTQEVHNKSVRFLEKIVQKHSDLNARNSKRQIKIGVSSFSNTYKRDVTKIRQITKNSLSGLKFKNTDETNMKDGLVKVLSEFDTTTTDSKFIRLLVLMSDGMSTDPDGVKTAAKTLRDKRVTIITIASSAYIDDVLLKDISSLEKTDKLYFEYLNESIVDEMSDTILNRATSENQVQVKPSRSPDLMTELRGIKLLPPEDKSMTSAELAALAIQSGFPCVQHGTDSSVNVFVKPHDGFRTQSALFLKINLNYVQPPVGQEQEYEYPRELNRETRKGLLFDGFDEEADISDHYKIKHFLSPSKRAFRLDTTIVECLEAAIDDLRQNITIVPKQAYKTRSANQENMGRRHREEKWRHQAGQALAVKPAKRKTSLVDVGTSLIRACSPLLRLQRRSIGIGCHKDFIYFDLRPSKSTKTADLIVVWDVDNKVLYKNMSGVKTAVTKGGPPIIPDDPLTACPEPDYGEDLFYLTFRKGSGFCSGSSSSSECAKEKPEREKVGTKFLKDLVKAAGSGTISEAAIRPDLRKCLIETCGGCPGSGTIWSKKVESCASLVHKYLDKVKNAFRNIDNKTTFFNTDNVNSSMHSLACHDKNMCVENTQLYSLLSPIVTAKYKPDPKLSSEEMVFDPTGNPTPLAEIVEQELAYRCSGNVKVFIEKESDINAMRNILKILMVYNRKINNVEFHIAHSVSSERVIGTVQKKIETWATTSCPSRSRLAIAPFSKHVVSKHRTKRSLERSKERNEEKFRMRNWEIEWLLST